MKNLFNKYCDFIGVENEGYRRILLVVNILFYFYGINWLYEDSRPRDDIDLLLTYTIPLLFSIFSIGVIIKTFNWVKGGFNK